MSHAVESLTAKQLDHVITATARINVADGPVRAGKTVGNNVAWLEFQENGPRGALGMLGKTVATLQRNVLDELEEMLGNGMFRYSNERGSTIFWVKTSWGWRKNYLFGANDAKAESKIRGNTLAGAYCNEVTLYPESVFDMLITRCSIKGARVFADCNPDSPYHWFFTKYLNNKELLDTGVLKRFRYKLEDNTHLDPSYVEDLHRIYKGVFKLRMLDGEWVMAEGAIYDMLDETIHVVDALPNMRRLWVCCDYGTTNPFVALLLGEGEDDRLYVCSEYRWDSAKERRQMTDAQYSRALSDWMALRVPYERLDRIFVDPSAASFIVQLHNDATRDMRLRRVAPADNEVLDGIRSISTLLGEGRLRIHRSCEGLRAEMGSYVWDPDEQEKGEDAPLKKNDHGPDALRYGINGIRTVWMRWIRLAA